MLAKILAYATLIMTILGFVLTVIDRVGAKASKGSFRIHENILFIIACLLGAPGVMLGMLFAPRGLYKQEVRLGIPAIALGEVVLLFWAVPNFWIAMKAIFAG